MSIEPNSIAVGLCYRTPAEEVRKVKEVEGDNVKYVARGGTNRKDWEKSALRRNATKAVFAAEVECQVKCHWDKDFPERKT